MTSFPKAKIHRFNELTTCAPPPGTYDPKLEKKVKGAVLSSSKRFPDQMCISSSLDSLDKANPPSITFRTPQVVRKKIPLTPRLKYLQEKKFETPGSDTSSVSSEKQEVKLKKDISQADYQRLERELSALADQRLNELLEKDVEISILEKEIKEIQRHEIELREILEEKNGLITKRSQEHLMLKENLDTMIEKLSKEREENQAHIEELEEIIAEKKDAIVSINDKYLDLENKLIELMEEKESYQQELKRVEKTNFEILDRVLSGATQEIEKLDETLKLKLKAAEDQFDSAVQALHVDFQSKLNLLSHELVTKTGGMEKELESCFEAIKELKRTMKEKVESFSKEITEADERCRLLFRELCKVEKERDDLVQFDLERKLVLVETEKKILGFEENLAQYKTKCKKYEVTLNSMQDTIQVLSERLLESDQEVERLSNVEEGLISEKQALEEKSQLLLEDIFALREGMDSLEKGIIADVQDMKDHLILKLEQFKSEAAQKVELLNRKISEKQLSIDLLLNENEYFKTELERKDGVLSDLQSKLSQYKEEVCILNEKQIASEEEFSERICAERNLQQILNDKLENANNVIEELRHLQVTLEQSLVPLNENLERYKSACVTLEMELQSLKTEVSNKNAEIINLQTEIKCILDNTKETEIDMQQNISDLVSDLSFEKERVRELESEKNQIKSRLFSAEESYNKKSLEMRDLNCVLETLEKKLKNTEEEKSKLENQIVDLETTNSELKQEMKETISKMERENEELQSDNVHKAQCILEFSMQIDNLKVPLSYSDERIACLEAEKESLTLQLDEASLEKLSLRESIAKKEFMISDLKNQLDLEKENYQQSLRTIQGLHNALDSANERQKSYLKTDLKLSEAEETIFDLQKVIADLEKQVKSVSSWQEENKVLKDELDVASMKLKVVIEERDKANKEVAELLGHQNIQQKIKHVSSIKQARDELKDKCTSLEIEVIKLKSKLAEFQGKENAVPHREITPKPIKSKISKKLTLSPGVLRERNQ